MALTRNHVKLNRFEALESYDLTWLQKLNLARICKKHALELYSST